MKIAPMSAKFEEFEEFEILSLISRWKDFK